jgi:tetratricopeptide (TPR) repeat protein
MSELRGRWLLAALVAVATPHAATADPAPPADTQKARQLVEDGIKAQDRGDYEVAIQKYQQAYRLRPHPTLIFNLAQVHRLAGHDPQARTLYQRYLSEVSTGGLANDARQFLTEIDARLEAAAAQHPAAPPPQVLPPPPVVPEPPAPVIPPAPIEPAPGRNLRLAGIAAAAAGTVSLVVGVGFWVHSSSLNDEFARRYDPANPAASQHLRDAGFRANTVAWVTGITGGALIAGGATLYWWSYRRDRPSDSVVVAPVISDHTAGLAIAGSIW